MTTLPGEDVTPTGDISHLGKAGVSQAGTSSKRSTDGRATHNRRLLAESLRGVSRRPRRSTTGEGVRAPLRDGVVYQVYLPSFADGNGDGHGDLAGLRDRLGYLTQLGVDAFWLTPHYDSPFVDGGYDISDHRSVDPRFGTLGDFDALVGAAHRRGLRILVDVVPNHTSSRHKWFEAARAGDPEARARYHFLPGRPDGGPPNNWQSLFGGSAWSRDERSGDYFLHLFAAEQPDLNWRNPSVHYDFEKTLRFWLDRGVDGIRVDVAFGLFKDSQFRDNPGAYSPTLFGHGPEQRHTWDQPEVHDVYRRWHRLLSGYEHSPISVGEVSLADLDAVAGYVRPDELGSAFTLPLLKCGWDAPLIADIAAGTIEAFDRVGARPAWVLGNHDKSRLATRFGGGAIGRERARAAALLLLALPGHAYLYAGDELGLEDAFVPDEARRDPIFHRTGGARLGRDGVRVPLPWEAAAPGCGFSPVRVDGKVPSWLPQPAGWERHSVDRQSADRHSMLSLYTAALRARRASTLFGHGTGTVEALEGGLLRVALSDAEGARGYCWVNMGERPASLPDGFVVLASGAYSRERGRLVLPPGRAIWVQHDTGRGAGTCEVADESA